MTVAVKSLMCILLYIIAQLMNGLKFPVYFGDGEAESRCRRGLLNVTINIIIHTFIVNVKTTNRDTFYGRDYTRLAKSVTLHI